MSFCPVLSCLSVILPSDIPFDCHSVEYCYIELRCVKCHSAECHPACHSDQLRSGKHLSAEGHSSECHSAKCHGALIFHGLMWFAPQLYRPIHLVCNDSYLLNAKDCI